MTRIILVTTSLVAFLMLVVPASAGPVEERCTELGTACVCSEPLRYTSAGTLQEGGDEDPPDSEGPGAKECNGGLALDPEATGIQLVDVVDNASDVDFPGPNPPEYVLKMTSGLDDNENSWLIFGTLPTGVQNETICARSYQRFGNDLQIAVEDMRIKMSQAVAGTELYHDGIISGGEGHFNIRSDGPDCDGAANIQLEGRTSWIRHEFCLDVGTTSVERRGRVTVIETGVTNTLPCGSVSVSTPVDFNEFLIGNLFLQTVGNPAFIGSRYVTHAIQTRVWLDPGFWPGPATELEADPDHDGLVDANDNCTQVANPGQQDIESDGCGDVCDGDFNDNGATEAADFSIFTKTYLKSSGDPGYDTRADMNDDGVVSIHDFILFRPEYLGTPGPGKPDCP